MANVYDKIRDFLPEAAGDGVIALLNARRPRVKITRARKSRLGTFKASPTKDLPHLISVNGDLNKYQFLVTLLHEIAHLDTFNTYKRRCKPHGKEWKANYQLLMHPFLTNSAVFPSDIREVLSKHMENPTASTFSNIELKKKLHDQFTSQTKKEGIKTLAEISEGELFFLSKRIYVKGPKMRTRYLCKEHNSGVQYSIHPLAEVVPLEKPPVKNPKNI